MSTPDLADDARKLARQNIDALLDGGFDAIITNAAGCGSTLKEYGELLEHDPDYAEKARRFAPQVKDVNEFLASIELNTEMRRASHGRHLSGFLPSRPRPKNPQRSAQAAAIPSLAWNCARCSYPICAAAARVSTTLFIPAWRWRC